MERYAHLKELKEGLSGIHDRIDSMDEKLSTRIDKLDEKLNLRMGAIEKRMDSIDEKLDRLLS